MEKIYKIGITLSKNKDDNQSQPYHWLLISYENDYQNEASGWAITPDKAWNEAYNYFVMYKNKTII